MCTSNQEYFGLDLNKQQCINQQQHQTNVQATLQDKKIKYSMATKILDMRSNSCNDLNSM
jgi:hypothetical protein